MEQIVFFNVGEYAWFFSIPGFVSVNVHFQFIFRDKFSSL